MNLMRWREELSLSKQEAADILNLPVYRLGKLERYEEDLPEAAVNLIMQIFQEIAAHKKEVAAHKDRVRAISAKLREVFRVEKEIAIKSRPPKLSDLKNQARELCRQHGHELQARFEGNWNRCNNSACNQGVRVVPDDTDNPIQPTYWSAGKGEMVPGWQVCGDRDT